MERGHQVTLAAPARFKTLIEENKINFAELAGSPEDLSRKLNDAGCNFVRQVLELMSHVVAIGAEVMRQTDQVCKDADLIVHTFAHAVGAHTLACEKNIPDVYVDLFPMFAPTGDYPNISLPDFSNRIYNRLTHIIAAQISWITSLLGFEQIRRRAGLPRRRLFSPFQKKDWRLSTPILCAWSPVVLPRSSDWLPGVQVSGYFYSPLKEFYSVPPELDSFLSSGAAPVCISFGSMVNKDARRIDDVIRQALIKTGQRGVILSGWGSVNRESTDDFLYLESATHDWLLPKCKMLIHHGGAGTTSAGLRAGIPQVVVPFMADQPFWGQRVHAIGVAPKPIPVNKLSVENVAHAIIEAESKHVLERAQIVGRMIRSEDGVASAVKLIEACALRFYESA